MLTGCCTDGKNEEPHQKTNELLTPHAQAFHTLLTGPLAVFESSRKQPLCLGGWGEDQKEADLASV